MAALLSNRWSGTPTCCVSLTMPKKPPFWRQPSLFSLDSDDSPEPENQVSYSTEGDQHEVQDNSPRTPATTNGVARAAADHTAIVANAGNLCQGTEGQPPSLGGNSQTTEAG